jgi:hypothetical protein
MHRCLPICCYLDSELNAIYIVAQDASINIQGNGESPLSEPGSLSLAFAGPGAAQFLIRREQKSRQRPARDHMMPCDNRSAGARAPLPNRSSQ